MTLSCAFGRAESACLRRGLFPAHGFAVEGEHKQAGDDESRAVRDGGGVENAVQSKEQGKNQNERREEQHLPRQREEHAARRFADRGEEVGGQDLHAVDRDHKQIDPQKAHGEFKILRRSGAEQGNDLLRAELEQKKSHNRNDQVAGDGETVGCPDARKLLRAVVEADNRLASL